MKKIEIITTTFPICALSLLIDPPALAAAMTDKRIAPTTEYTMVPVMTGPGTDMVLELI